jgi:tetratricopeptide (TPR) repeat protein
MKQYFVPVFLLFLFACKQNEKKTDQQEISIPVIAQKLYDEVAQYPDSTALRIQLVNTLDSVGAIRLALAQMDSLIVRDSLNFGIWFHKAQLSEKAGDTLLALHSYDKAARIYPSPDALLSMANLYAEKKDTRAVILCDQVEQLRLGREYLAHCSFIKGVYYARTGELVKALTSFDRCIANDYQYMEAYMEKGFIFYDTQQADKAIAVFNQAIEIRPTYADAFYWLGKTYEQKGDKDNSIKEYQRSLVLDPSIKEAKDALERLGAG